MFTIVRSIDHRDVKSLTTDKRFCYAFVIDLGTLLVICGYVGGHLGNTIHCFRRFLNCGKMSPEQIC